jgi:hypothetical protein
LARIHHALRPSPDQEAAHNRRTVYVSAESERKNELLTRETHRPIVGRSPSAMSNRSRLLSQRLKLPACST